MVSDECIGTNTLNRVFSHRVGIAEFERRQRAIISFDLEHREIGILVGTEQGGDKFAPVGERDGNFVAVGDDMPIGNDDPIGGHDYPRAQRILYTLAWRVGKHPAKKPIKQRIALERAVAAGGDHPSGKDIDHRRRHRLDQRRVGQTNLVERARHDTVLGHRRRGEREQYRY